MDIYLYLLFVNYHILINKSATVCEHQATEVPYVYSFYKLQMCCEEKKTENVL